MAVDLLGLGADLWPIPGLDDLEFGIGTSGDVFVVPSEGSSGCNASPSCGTSTESQASPPPRPTPMDKQARLREKSRRAQARYRARRKAATGDLNNRYEEVRNELALARREHALLSGLVEAQERMLHVSDAFVSFLRSAGDGLEGGTSPPRPLQTRRAALLALPGTSLGQRGKLDSMREHELSAEDEAAVRRHAAREVGDLVADMEAQLQELRATVLAYDAALESGSPAQAERALHGVLGMEGRMVGASKFVLLALLRAHPHVVGQVVNHGRDAVAADRTDEARVHWARVVERLGLDDTQAAQLAALHDALVRREHQLLRERAYVLRATGLPAYDSLHGHAQSTLQTRAVVEALERNLEAQCMLYRQRTSAAYAILSPLQRLRCAAYSYPFFPDMFRIMEGVHVPEARRSGAPPPEFVELSVACC